MDELNSTSLGTNIEFLYGYGFWGRYREINENLKLGKVTCDYEKLNLVIEEYYQVFIEDCDKLDSIMSEYLATELNMKIKVEIFLEQREVAFLSPSKICENLNFSTEIQIFANFDG